MKNPFDGLSWLSQINAVYYDLSRGIETEKLADLYIREYDGMHNRISCQSRIDGLEEFKQCVLGVFRLNERVFDGMTDSITSCRKPRAIFDLDSAALHLQDKDAQVGN